MINLHRHIRTANPRRPRAAAARFAPSADSRCNAPCRLQPAARSLPRRGISLLEVLISMFVLLFGLMGVAAIFPVGNHYAGRGEQFDRGSALAEAAFADLKARGMLQPEKWYYADHQDSDGNNQVDGIGTKFLDANWQLVYPLTGTNPLGPGHSFVIDPMGAADFEAPLNDRICFPFGNRTNQWQSSSNPTPPVPLAGSRWPIQRLTLPIPNPSGNPADPPFPMSSKVSETIFRLHDDVTNELPKENDRPGMQRWATDLNGAPQNEPWRHTLLARQYAGSYSWLATVVPTSNYGPNALQPFDSRFKNELYEVSVAVFNKREVLPSAESERMLSATLVSSQEVQLFDPGFDPAVLEAAMKDIRPGHWIALTGVHETTGQFMLKWYRLMGYDEDTGIAGIDGPEWPQNSMTNLRAILLPGVISVSTQMLPMESAQ